MVIPSTSVNGSPSTTIRSAKVPESPSSKLHATNFRSESVSRTVCHLIPAGKPAPPRPRSPESATSCTTCAGASDSALRRPAQPPCARRPRDRRRVHDAHPGEAHARCAVSQACCCGGGSGAWPRLGRSAPWCSRPSPPTSAPASSPRPIGALLVLLLFYLSSSFRSRRLTIVAALLMAGAIGFAAYGLAVSGLLARAVRGRSSRRATTRATPIASSAGTPPSTTCRTIPSAGASAPRAGSPRARTSSAPPSPRTWTART